MKSILLLAMTCLLASCAAKKVITDFDPAYDFSRITNVQILTPDVSEQPSLNYAQRLLQEKLLAKGINTDANAEITIRLKMDIQQRANDQSISIGLGSHTGGRHSSIGIGTSVNIPIGEETVDWQVMQLDLIEQNQVIWTAHDEAKISIRDGKGLNKLHNDMLDRLLEQLPINTKTEPQ
ncbi:DUF4136 domain-containing protein [Alteromonas facilis]|uniref:DUF4136 domain-containing protein n=1 Tax=Alteromonas facilis TaxID=2048004 RepID=UPI000F5D399B|nr:DUF4136 domain-containing protein [Alteromonas facilis]